jgi:hypothetical protein
MGIIVIAAVFPSSSAEDTTTTITTTDITDTATIVDGFIAGPYRREVGTGGGDIRHAQIDRT